MEPRSAAAARKDFPYTARTTCYIEIHEDGTVTHRGDRAAYERTMAGTSRLFAVRPGEWSSHLFVIDDLDEYAKAHGIKHDEERTGLKEHAHDARWEPASHANDSTRSPYVSVDVTLDCGCEIHDRRTFAAQRLVQADADIEGRIDWSMVSVDSTSCRVHQHAAGARCRPQRIPGRRRGRPAHHPADEALGRSLGSWRTKIHLAGDGRCRPLALLLTPGQWGMRRR